MMMMIIIIIIQIRTNKSTEGLSGIKYLEAAENYIMRNFVA
jgi:hypothetical protein